MRKFFYQIRPMALYWGVGGVSADEITKLKAWGKDD